MPEIIVDKLNMGGLADSKFAGVENSVAEMVGLDIHSKPGVVRVHQKMTKDTNFPTTEFIKVAVNISTGLSVWFSSTTGKIWVRQTDGTVDLAHTTTPAAGGAGCLGALQYQEYLYWATELRLHRIPIANVDASWAGETEDFGTFDVGDDEFHPFLEQNKVLYIGDGNQVAQVEDGVFSSNALDIKAPYRITALGPLDTDLLIGTFVNDNVTQTKIFRWNTWSVDFTSSDPLPEIGINAFLSVDNFVLVSAGIYGNLYFYNGSQLEQYKRIPGDYSPTATCIIHPNARANFLGMPLFGVSNRVGNPCKEGIYSLCRYDRNYPMVLNLDHPISEDVVSGIEIGVILPVGADLFVSWKNGAAFGVDQLDYTAKYANAYYITLVIKPDRDFIKTFRKFVAAYDTLPTGCSFTLTRKAGTDSDFVALTSRKDAKHRAYVALNKVDATSLQVKVAFGVSSNDAPELEELKVII